VKGFPVIIAEQSSSNTPEIRADVQNRLRAFRRRLLWQRLLHTFAAVTVLVLIGHWLATPKITMLQQVLAVAVVFFAQLWLSPKWRRLNTNNFLRHLNRRFPDFEESAQLLLLDASDLKPLQSLQRDRALAVYRKNLAQLGQWQAPVRYRPVVAICLACLALFLFTDELASLVDRSVSKRQLAPVSAFTGDKERVISDISIRIEPPAYTGLEAVETDELDLELPQDSLVEWNFSYETNGHEYVLRLSDDRQIELTSSTAKQLFASAVIDKSGLYRLARIGAEEEQTTGEIHSLAVILDRAPVIRMIEPEVSSLEIPKSGPARFTSRAMVKDDYGLNNVEILASVAKGSGEGVKFRDEKLQFDRFTETGKERLYHKEWDLKALGMEPGDEVYFTVIATDNRLPEANTGRSETLIVRWREDQPPAIAAEGLAIDFIPEFFKSQRQIIIDTETLIEDKPGLLEQAFRDISFETGQAQADLKQKYGQYLGDEFGEGAGPHTEGSHEEGHEGDEESHADDHGDAVNSADLGNNMNSVADIVRLFGHDHGDPEIGPITRRNPVALMKRAVNEMWQAERHLMQAEPELALPFEYEAYKYLKLARQADRIYVKRLGFEPPPVSEERRLSGELDEILSYRVSAPEPVIDEGGEKQNQNTLKYIYHLLTTYSSDYTFDNEQRELLSMLSGKLTTWSQQRAALIRHAATLEELSLNGRLALDDCENCLEDLTSVIWNLIDEDAGQLYQRKPAWYAGDGLIQSYQQALKKHAGDNTDATNANGGRQ